MASSVSLSLLRSVESGSAPGGRSGPSLDELLACIDGAAETTSAALVRVRAALDEVQRASEAHVSELRAAMLAVAGDDGSSMAANFVNLDRAVEHYLTRVQAEASLQNELAQRAVEQCGAILEAARRIARVAYVAKILGLNAAAKAAATPDSGALDVIVQQISRLTVQTSGLAAQAVAAGTALVDVLPAIAHSASDLLAEASTFSARFHASVQTLGPNAMELQRALGADLARADTRLQRLVALSRRAREVLDFEEGFLDGLDATGQTTSSMFALCADVEATSNREQQITSTTPRIQR